jgi:hypothetical protein
MWVLPEDEPNGDAVGVICNETREEEDRDGGEGKHGVATDVEPVVLLESGRVSPGAEGIPFLFFAL